jgi:hypothetical protein
MTSTNKTTTAKPGSQASVPADQTASPGEISGAQLAATKMTPAPPKKVWEYIKKSGLKDSAKKQ